MLYRLFVVAVVVFGLVGTASAQTTAAQADFDGSGVVDLADFLQFVSAFGYSTGDDNFQAKFDLDSSGTVDLADFLQFVNVFGQTVPESAEPPPPTADSVEGDRAALVALYNATDGDNWRDNWNWLSDKPLGDWSRVDTNAQGRVKALELRGNKLSGSIPESIGNLTNLQSLSLNLNQLSGSIPSTLGNLSKLTYLDLSENQLSGPIPESIGNLSNLEELRLYRNYGLCYTPSMQQWIAKYTLGVPPCGDETDRAALVALYNATDGDNWRDNWNWLSDKPLGDWYGVTTNEQGRVRWLSLWGHQLTGSIPESIGNLTKLEGLRLEDNQLTGSIPESIGNLTKLEVLRLSENQLSGSIPESIGNLTNLTRLDLSENQLSGPIPASIGNLTNLEELRLWRNQLSGSIPESIGNLTNLTFMSLWSNQLSGPIPESMRNLTKLERLGLGGNDPYGLCYTPNMQQWIAKHNLSEPPCGDETDRAALVALYNATDGDNWTDNTNWLSDVPLTGWRGVTTNEQGRVERLNLRENQLTGSIPTELGNLTNLESLRLGGNQLSGPIPESIGNLTNLTRLDLYENQLSGPIPTWLDTLAKLTSLNLRDNQLSGGIPESIRNLRGLRYLNLRNNNLSGPIPAGVIWLTRLESFYISGNAVCLPNSLLQWAIDVKNSDLSTINPCP